jgi:hypothetical protein
MRNFQLKAIFLKCKAYLLLISLLVLTNSFTYGQTSVVGGTTSNNYSLTASAVSIDPAITITSGANIDGFRVTVSTGFKSADELSYTGTLPSSISASYNSSTGILTFTGSTTTTDWQTLLRTVTYRNLNSAQFGDRTITFSAGTLSKFSRELGISQNSSRC